MKTNISPESDSKDQHLLRRVAAGDSGAFWDLWSQHQDRLFSICYAQMGRRREDAEDALSDVREKARITLIREASEVRNLTAWLARMAVNCCIDIYRRDKRFFARAGGSDDSAPEERLRCLPSTPDACPAARLLASEVRAMVTHAVGELAPRLRVASSLYFLEEASYPEIAARLAISEANARKRIQEARGTLRTQLRSARPRGIEV